MNNLDEVIAFLESYKPVHFQAGEDLQSALLFLKEVKEWEDVPSDCTLCEKCGTIIELYRQVCNCGHDRTR